MTDDFREMLDAIGDLSIQFWACPTEEHRGQFGEELRTTVEWRGDVAHCTRPGCGRTSMDGRGAA